MTQSVAPRITHEKMPTGPNVVHVDFIRDPETATYSHDDWAVIARLEAQKAGYTLIGGYLCTYAGETVTITFTEKRARR